MNDQTKQAMQMALEALEDSRNLVAEYLNRSETNEKAITALREALAQPQCNQHPDAPHGFDRNASHSADRYVCECESWAQPQGEPVGRFYWESIADGIVVALPSCGTPHFEKDDFPLFTTPQVTPQGDPVAWIDLESWNEGEYDCLATQKVYDYLVPVYTTPPSVEAAIEATKEKAAKFLETTDICGDAVMDELAAAIRNMK